MKIMGLKEYWLMEWIPLVGMVMVELLDVGLITLSKAAISKGMNQYVSVVYSNALAALILLPTSFIFNRANSHTPPLSLSILYKFFLLSLFGITLMQNCGFTGIRYSSPTLASAMSSLTPAFTFLLAAIFSVTGAGVIVIGFYTVLWAQSKEQNDYSQKLCTQPSSPSQRSPLLESHHP